MSKLLKRWAGSWTPSTGIYTRGVGSVAKNSAQRKFTCARREPPYAAAAGRNDVFAGFPKYGDAAKPGAQRSFGKSCRRATVRPQWCAAWRRSGHGRPKVSGFPREVLSAWPVPGRDDGRRSPAQWRPGTHICIVAELARRGLTEVSFSNAQNFAANRNSRKRVCWIPGTRGEGE